MSIKKLNFIRKKNNIIVLIALFTLIIGSAISLSLQQSKSDEPSYVIINQSVTGNGTGVTGDGVNERIAVWNGTSSIISDPNFRWLFNNNFLGINQTGDIHSHLQVNGSIALPIRTTISNTTLTVNDFIILCNPTTTITINLPTTNNINGRIYVIKKVSADNTICIIDPNSTETIDNSLTLELMSPNTSLIIQTDGNNWNIIAEYNLYETTVASWDRDRSFSNIGIVYVDIYTVTGSSGLPRLIDTTGKTQAQICIQWNRVGTGTQTVQVIDINNSANILATSPSLLTGHTCSTIQTIPIAQQNQFITYKLQAKSTTSTDDPVFQGAQILLR